MGSMVSLPLPSLWQKKEYQILIAGPDYGAGPIETVPTVGLNIESSTYGGMNFVFLDKGGRDKLRPAWGVYLAKTTAIIFVVDSADISQLDHAANELKLLLDFEYLRELRDVPLLVFANKQDLEGAKSPVEISEALNLGELGRRRWNIAPCSVIDGVGVSGGMDWLLSFPNGQKPRRTCSPFLFSVSLFTFTTSVATFLLPGKEWVREWFPPLWPKTNREDAFHSANLELETVLEHFRNDEPSTPEAAAIQDLLRTVGSLQTEIIALRGSLPVGRIETISSGADPLPVAGPSGQDR
ncbi:unnamed protein product [Penicillium viridicatum]